MPKRNYLIEHDVPVPPINFNKEQRLSSRPRRPWAGMQVGDSFLVTDKDEGLTTKRVIDNFRSKLYASAGFAGIHILTRRVLGNKATRVWRVVEGRRKKRAVAAAAPPAEPQPNFPDAEGMFG